MVSQTVNYAILSAGEGSRLQQEGVATPKPLVRLNGVPMVERLINIFVQNHAKSISIISNNIHPEVNGYLQEMQKQLNIPLNIVCKTTPSSLHSFYELAPYLQGEKFCLTTVDTIFSAQELSAFIQHFCENSVDDGVMAVTDYVDDEKPLYVQTNGEQQITAFLDSNDGSCRYVSGGIYSLTPKVFGLIERAKAENMSRMRNFQRAMLQDGLRLKAYPFSKILDVDHAEDIRKAEEFLKEVERG